MGMNDLSGSQGIEDGLAGEHFVKDTAERIEIGLRAFRGRTGDLFGGHVQQRSDGLSVGGEMLACCQECKSEIAELDLIPTGEQEIPRFDIAMNNPLSMGVLERAAHWQAVIDGLAPGNRSFFADDGRDRSPSGQPAFLFLGRQLETARGTCGGEGSDRPSGPTDRLTRSV